MTEQQLAFVNAALRVCQARDVMAVLLKDVLEPTSTGYLHGLEFWAAQPYETDSGFLQVTFAPPEGAYEWRFPTEERLSELRTKLGCDLIWAQTSPTGIVYVATFENNKEPVK